jgi:hypothetical protein
MPSPQSDAQRYIASALSYQRQTVALRTATATAVERAWRSLGSWREQDMPPFLAAVVPLVNGAQRAMLSLTTAYLAQQKQNALGGKFTPVVVDPALVVGAAARGGVTPRQVYERPFHLTWRQIADLPREPGAVDQAINAGRDRATSLALDDLQLTKVQASQRVLSLDGHVVGYRRTLEGEHSCGLCIVASTQRYHHKDLMPIHGGCDCDVAPIYGDLDPGHVIDPLTLDGVHDRIAERFGVSARDARAVPDQGLPDYKDILVVHEHGELGPVLGVRGQPFLGPDDIAA